MPSTMIHLMVAKNLEPGAGALNLIGNFAPDAVGERAPKDKIHLRDRDDRAAALSALRDRLGTDDPLARGWLTHLYADARWDEEMIRAFRAAHEREAPDAPWFSDYRAEIARATFYLYHTLDWAEGAMNEIRRADLSGAGEQLPVPMDRIAAYRDIVVLRHAQSDPASRPQFFRPEAIADFARETAARCADWLKGA